MGRSTGAVSAFVAVSLCAGILVVFEVLRVIELLRDGHEDVVLDSAVNIILPIFVLLLTGAIGAHVVSTGGKNGNGG